MEDLRTPGRGRPEGAPPVVAVRPAERADTEAWLHFGDLLWPGSRREHEEEISAYLAEPREDAMCFVAELPDGRVVGFVEVGLRGYAEGCFSFPVGYLEGIFVLAEYRSGGVGRALVDSAERWARERGCTEMASDRELANEASGAFHEALGYEEVERIVCFKKSLAGQRGRDPRSREWFPSRGPTFRVGALGSEPGEG